MKKETFEEPIYNAVVFSEKDVYTTTSNTNGTNSTNGGENPGA